jgi:hypothetical protein
MRCNSTLENTDLRLKVIDLNCFEWIFSWAIIIMLLVIHGSRTLQAGATASAYTTRELSNAEAFLSASLLFVSAAHLWPALCIDILLTRELWDWNAAKSTWEISCVNGLIGDDCSIHWFEFIVLNNHLLLLVIIEAFWKGRALVAAIYMICSDFKRFKIVWRSHNATIVGRNSANWVHIAKLLRFSWVSSLMHMRLRVWLRWLTTLTLNGSEISTSTVLQANSGRIHVILMWTLFLKSYFWNNNAITRSDSTGSFRLKGSHSSWIGSCWYGILSTSADYWFNFRARYPTPVSRMAWAHYDMLCIALLCQLLLWKSVWNHVFSIWGHDATTVTWRSSGKFTSWWPFVLKLNLHLLVGRELVVNVLRRYHHCLDHLLLVMRRCGSIIGGVDWPWIWSWWLLTSFRVGIQQVIEQRDAWLILD